MFDLQTVEAAVNISHRLHMGREAFACSNQAHVTAACCLSIAYKFCQGPIPMVKHLMCWLKKFVRVTRGGVKPRNEKDELELWGELVRDTELSILAELDWSVMPQPTSTGLLFMTGLLEGAHEECLLTMRDAILGSFRRWDTRPAGARPYDRFMVLQQVRWRMHTLY